MPALRVLKIDKFNVGAARVALELQREAVGVDRGPPRRHLHIEGVSGGHAGRNRLADDLALVKRRQASGQIKRCPHEQTAAPGDAVHRNGLAGPRTNEFNGKARNAGAADLHRTGAKKAIESGTQTADEFDIAQRGAAGAQAAHAGGALAKTELVVAFAETPAGTVVTGQAHDCVAHRLEVKAQTNGACRTRWHQVERVHRTGGGRGLCDQVIAAPVITQTGVCRRHQAQAGDCLTQAGTGQGDGKAAGHTARDRGVAAAKQRTHGRLELSNPDGV